MDVLGRGENFRDLRKTFALEKDHPGCIQNATCLSMLPASDFPRTGSGARDGDLKSPIESSE